MWSGGGGGGMELTHLGSSSPVSIHGCWRARKPCVPRQ